MTWLEFMCACKKIILSEYTLVYEKKWNQMVLLWQKPAGDGKDLLTSQTPSPYCISGGNKVKQS